MGRRIFVVVSIIFLSFMVLFYGYRLVHYYSIDKKKDTVTTLSNQIIVRTKKLVSVNDEYYFKGNSNDNYINFSGLTYRIISLNDEYLTLISDEDLTKLKFGLNNSYKDSDIKLWLENIYTNNINKDLLYSNKVTLLNKDMYINIGGSDSFIKSNNMWILDGDKGLVISEDGNINNPDAYNYFLNIRPVIKIKNCNYISGSGTLEDPYIIESKTTNKLEDTYVGEYIKYKDKNYRIVSKENGIRVVSLESIGEFSFSSGTNLYKYTSNADLYYKLNTNYLSSLNKEDLVMTNWNNGSYNSSYKETKSIIMSNYVGLLSVGDYFINNIKGYTLSTSGNFIYIIRDDQSLYLVKPTAKFNVYPSFSFKKELTIKGGSGTLENPYEVGE